MAVRPRGNGFQADVAWKGKRVREQFETEAAAHKWHDAALEAVKAGKPVPPARAEVVSAYSTIEGLLNVIIATDWGRKRGCEASITYARMFVAFVGPALAPSAALTQENVDAWITSRIQGRAISGSTVNRHLSAVNKLVKKAIAAGLVPRRLELPYEEEGDARIRWFSDEEEALILQTLRLWNRPLEADFFAFLCDTGARTWTEAQRLPWRDVTGRPHRLATFHDTKNNDSRAVPLTQRAWEAIERQRGNGLEGPFRGVSKDDCRRLYDRLRVHLPALHDTVWYTARHTFASRLVQRGVDLYRVQKLMGHRSAEMTMRYAKLAPTHLIDAIAVLEPSSQPKPKLEAVA